MRRAAVLLSVALVGAGAVFGIASSASADTPPLCGGQVLLPKPDGGLWTCTFDDEFDATTGDATTLDTSKWTPQQTATSGYATGQPPGVACYLNSPNNISVSDGALHLTARQESQPFNCSGYTTQYTSGMVSTKDHFTQTYGRFEVRAKLPDVTVPGLQETLWLWPENPTYGAWPASGEIDFSEFYSQYYNLDVPYIHYDYDKTTTNHATNTNVVTAYDCTIDITQYNNYVLTWSPGTLTITVNGKPCLTDNYQPNNVQSPAPFDQPFFLALTQGLGVGTNALTANTPLPATTDIDYVRVWK